MNTDLEPWEYIQRCYEAKRRVAIKHALRAVGRDDIASPAAEAAWAAVAAAREAAEEATAEAANATEAAAAAEAEWVAVKKALAAARAAAAQHR